MQLKDYSKIEVTRPMLGASFMAATASLISSLMPFVVSAVANAGSLPIGMVGLIATAYMVGQFTVVFMLPTLGIASINKGFALIAAVLLLGSLSAVSAVGGTWMLLPWFCIGGVSGVFQFMAATSAALSGDRRKAFAMRVGVPMLINSVAIAGFQLFSGFKELSQFFGILGFSVFLLASIGIALYTRPPATINSSVNTQHTGYAWLVSLGVLFAFFVGQHGFYAFSVQQAQIKGILLSDIVFSIAFCKGIAGLYLLSTTAGRAQGAANAGLFLPGCCLATGIVTITAADTWLSLFIGLLFWELSINVLSARTQAIATGNNPALIGRWLSAAILSGAALGPAIHGFAIQVDHGGIFLTFAFGTALLPYLWQFSKRSC